MKKQKLCKICGEEYESSWARAKYCSMECKNQVNKNRYREKPDSVTWNSLMEFCNERDDYQCIECGSDKNLVVHHKKFLCDGGTNTTNNLITLCGMCHAKKHNLIKTSSQHTL